MEKTVCSICQSPKGAIACGVCTDVVCKSCAQFIDDESFQLLQPLPEVLSHAAYCPTCFDQNVASELESYNQTLEQAKEVLVFTKSQSKETRLIKRKESTLKVVDCADYDETIMRLAFRAAQGKFNAIVDVDLTSQKFKDGSYQTTKWTGTAIPVQMKPGKILPTINNPN